jgi:hypothetical protein
MTERDRPAEVLTRHFFTSLFELGFLSDDGAESLKRALLGSLAVVVALGLLLTRVFMAKYAALSDASPDAYQTAVVADHAFLMAVPMWVVGSAVGLVGHSLFPDQTDFRILMAEPLSRVTIFGSKLASLLLFVGLFLAATHLALLPLAALTMIGALKTGSVVAPAAAFVVSSVIASLFAALAIVAVHGLLVLLAPRARLVAFSGVVRSVLIAALVFSLPLIARLPATAEAFSSNAWWLSWAPPAWFVGLERWLIGDASRAGLAAQAAIGTVTVLIVSIVSYVVLYRRFDRVTVQSVPSPNERGWERSLAAWNGRPPVRHAVRRFVSMTIRRSFLHQSLVVGVLAATGALVLNSFLSADGWHEPFTRRQRDALIWTLITAPMTMVFLSIPAVRIALSIPLDLRSNWIFRMTEDVGGRAEVVAANVRIVLALGVVVPLAAAWPFQWWVLGPTAVWVLLVETSIGWLLVEWLMADWHRIPFTCSYIPGKGFVPYMVVKGFSSYLLFTLASGLVLRFSIARPRGALVFALIFGAAAAALAVRRARHAQSIALTFEDELPMDVTQMRLNAD